MYSSMQFLIKSQKNKYYSVIIIINVRIRKVPVPVFINNKIYNRIMYILVVYYFIIITLHLSLSPKVFFLRKKFAFHTLYKQLIKKQPPPQSLNVFHIFYSNSLFYIALSLCLADNCSLFVRPIKEQPRARSKLPQTS